MTKENRPVVWVTQETPQYNYLPAERFGDLKFITNKDFSAVRGSIINSDLMTAIRTAVRDIDVENDYMVVSGSPAVTAVVFMMLGMRTRMLRMLRWSNRDMGYTPIVLEIK